jgi:hypothetical protein
LGVPPSGATSLLLAVRTPLCRRDDCSKEYKIGDVLGSGSFGASRPHPSSPDNCRRVDGAAPPSYARERPACLLVAAHHTIAMVQAAASVRAPQEPLSPPVPCPPLRHPAAVVKRATCRKEGGDWAVKCIDKGKLEKEDEEALKTEVAILEQVRRPGDSGRGRSPCRQTHCLGRAAVVGALARVLLVV